MGPKIEHTISIKELMGSKETSAPVAMDTPQPEVQTPQSGIGSDARYEVTRGPLGQPQYPAAQTQQPVNTPVGWEEQNAAQNALPSASVGQVPGQQWTEADNTHELNPVAPTQPTLSLSKDLGVRQVRQYNILGHDIPEGANIEIQPLMDNVIGGWNAIADVMSAPVAAIANTVHELGLTDKNYTTAEMKDAIVQGLEKAGIAADKTKAFSEFWSDVGDSTMRGLMILGPMFLGAPSAAGMQMATGSGRSIPSLLKSGEIVQAGKEVAATGKNIVKNVATELLASPGTAVATEVAAGFGGELGSDIGEAIWGPNGEIIGRTIGTLGGAVGAAGATDIGAKALGAAKQGAIGGAVGGALELGGYGMGGGVPTTAGITGGAIRGWRNAGREARMKRLAKSKGLNAEGIIEAPSPELAQTVHDYAVNAVRRDQGRIEATLTNIFDNIAVKDANPTVVAEKLKNQLWEAYGRAQKIADQKYAAVDKSEIVHPGPGIEASIQDVLARTDSVNVGTDLPGDIIADMREGLRIRGRRTRTGEQVITYQPTLGKYLAIHGKIRAQLRDPSANFTDARRANLNKLDDAINAVLDKYAETNPALAEAQEYSKWLHNRFTNSDIGAFMGRGRGTMSTRDDTLGDLGNPAQRLNEVIRRERSGMILGDIAADKQLKTPEIEKTVGEFLSARFREEAASLDEIAPGAAKGQKYLQSPSVRRFTQQMPKVAAKLQLQGERLNKVLSFKKDLESSAFAKLAHQGTQTAVERMYNAPNKAELADQILKRVSGDPDALKAFQSTVVEELSRRVGADPTRMRDYLETKDLQPMLAKVLGSEKFSRLRRLVGTAAKYQEGQVSVGQRISQSGIPLVSRLFALRSAPASFSLQERSLISNLTRDLTTKMIAQVDPSTALSHALVDPNWERLLYAKLPENLEEAIWMERAMRNVITTSKATVGLLPDKDE